MSHSNSNARIVGSNNTFTGRLEYATTLQITGSGNQFQGGTHQVAPQPDPIVFNVADYAPGGVKATQAQAQGRYYARTGNYTLSATDVLSGGLWYINGGASLTASNLVGPSWGITIVSTGSLNFTGSSARNLSPYVDNLLLFSNKTGGTSTTSVLTISGSNHLWTGHLYAPNGLLSTTGSSNTLRGTLLGKWVRLVGSNLTINGEGFVCPGPLSRSSVKDRK